MEPDRILLSSQMVSEAELAKIRSGPAGSIPALLSDTKRCLLL
jgi:hypothetical protein